MLPLPGIPPSRLNRQFGGCGHACFGQEAPAMALTHVLITGNSGNEQSNAGELRAVVACLLGA